MKRWHILLITGLTGVASLLLATFEQLAPGQQLSFQIRLLMLIQPAILTIAAVAIGQALAGRVGLGTPLIDALVQGGSLRAVLRRQALPALSAGSCRRPADDCLFDSNSVCGYGCYDQGDNDRFSRSAGDANSLRWNNGRASDPMGLDVFFRMGALAHGRKGSGASGYAVGRYPGCGSPFRGGPPALIVCHYNQSATFADRRNPDRQFYPGRVVRVAFLASGTGGGDAFPCLRPLRECAGHLSRWNGETGCGPSRL